MGFEGGQVFGFLSLQVLHEGVKSQRVPLFDEFLVVHSQNEGHHEAIRPIHHSADGLERLRHEQHILCVFEPTRILVRDARDDANDDDLDQGDDREDELHHSRAHGEVEEQEDEVETEINRQHQSECKAGFSSVADKLRDDWAKGEADLKKHVRGREESTANDEGIKRRERHFQNCDNLPRRRPAERTSFPRGWIQKAVKIARACPTTLSARTAARNWRRIFRVSQLLPACPFLSARQGFVFPLRLVFALARE